MVNDPTAKFRNKGFEFEEIIHLDSLKERDPEIRSISPIRVSGTADIDTKQVTFHLHIKGELTLPSSRTLEDVQFPLDITSKEIFMYDVPDDRMDENLHPIQGEMINLYPIIEELILLEIPIQVYGEEDEQIPESLKSGENWEFVIDEAKKKNRSAFSRIGQIA